MRNALTDLLREIAGLPPEKALTQEIVEKTWTRLLSRRPDPLSPLARCPHCGGQARIADAPCSHCEDGFVQACANCESEAVDPLFAPACSGACREAWEAKQKAAHPAPILTRAP